MKGKIFLVKTWKSLLLTNACFTITLVTSFALALIRSHSVNTLFLFRITTV